MLSIITKNLAGFLAVFCVVFFASQGAFADVSDIVTQASAIFTKIKPLIFVAAAIWLVYTGIKGVIAGTIDWNEVLKVIGPLFLVLIAGYLVEIFSGGKADVYFE
ncbi:MAG: hypothetical protein JXR30_02455 [Alphaproteobacteria bacterium]|nr:hypothetical protein [Alphaproteobacteria bacterium]